MDNRTRFILSELQAAPKGMTAKELSIATGVRFGIVRDVLAGLVAEGTINDARGQRQVYTGRTQAQIEKGKAREHLVEVLGTFVPPEDVVKFIACSRSLRMLLVALGQNTHAVNMLIVAIDDWHSTSARVQDESKAAAEIEANPAESAPEVAS